MPFQVVSIYDCIQIVYAYANAFLHVKHKVPIAVKTRQVAWLQHVANGKAEVHLWGFA